MVDISGFEGCTRIEKGINGREQRYMRKKPQQEEEEDCVAKSPRTMLMTTRKVNNEECVTNRRKRRQEVGRQYSRFWMSALVSTVIY